MVLRIFQALGLTLTTVSAAACGGNVVVSAGGGEGGGENGGAGGGNSVPGCELSSNYEARYECFPASGGACPAAPEAESQLWSQIQGSDGCVGSGSCCTIEETCGPDPAKVATGSCCYDIGVDSFACEGRPFVCEGEVRIARVAARSDWQQEMRCPEVASLDAATRAALARRFSEAALFEHASVASFARFALELMGLGAPADLVSAAHRAMGDEIRHAEICFTLAGAYGGEPVGPSALSLSGAGMTGRSAAELAAAVAFEGCLNETISALLAAAEHDRASDPAVRAALGAIAADEASHAELAWRSLAWLLSIGGDDAASAVRAVFNASTRHDPRELSIEGADLRALAEAGYLGAEERRSIAERALRDVVMPCARALLDGTARPSAAIQTGMVEFRA
ncbi:MAG: ferritin-like domain-containing protein [Polyangiaceae bacterium]